jgi:hypothetical protein
VFTVYALLLRSFLSVGVCLERFCATKLVLITYPNFYKTYLLFQLHLVSDSYLRTSYSSNQRGNSNSESLPTPTRGLHNRSTFDQIGDPLDRAFVPRHECLPEN